MSGAPVVALATSRDGTVEETTYLELDGLDPPVHFTDLFGPYGAAKANAFLAAVATDGMVTDWEIPIETAGGMVLARFSGILREEQVVVFGWAGPLDFYDMYDELIRINNEQATALRSSLKSLARSGGATAPPDDEAFIELTQLSNELGVLQRELAKANVALAQLNERKNDVLGMVSHDLRNPITAISGFLQTVLRLDREKLSPVSVQILERALGASDFMAALVNDLLDLSAIEAGRVRLDQTECNLDRLLSEVIELTRPSADVKNIKLLAELDTDLAVWLDERKVQQVLANLLTNAVKFSPPASRVWVRSQADDGRIEFEVQDEGPGIPIEEQEGIFQAFGTGSNVGTDGETSTGLGLAIAKRVVEAHGGTLRVDSEPGHGARFVCAMPIGAPGSVAG